MNVQTVQTTPKKRQPVPMNGVDVPTLFATIGVVKGQPELAKFKFRATNRWVSGTHSRTQIESFSGAGAEHEHQSAFSYDADHPPVLCGTDKAPAPVEFVLHALAACLMAGVGNVASARGIRLEKVEVDMEGDLDVQGVLGLSQTVRNGFSQVRAKFRIEGDAPADQLMQVIEQARDRSAVFDILTNGIPVAIDVSAG